MRLILIALLLVGCGGGGSGSPPAEPPVTNPPPPTQPPAGPDPRTGLIIKDYNEDDGYAADFNFTVGGNVEAEVVVADPEFGPNTHGSRVKEYLLDSGYILDTAEVSGAIGYDFRTDAHPTAYATWRLDEDGYEHVGHAVPSQLIWSAQERYKMWVSSSHHNWPSDKIEDRLASSALHSAVDALTLAGRNEMVLVQSTENGEGVCGWEGDFYNCGELENALVYEDIQVTRFFIGNLVDGEKRGLTRERGELLYIEAEYTSYATPKAAAIIYRYMQENAVAYSDLYDAFVKDCTQDNVIICQ